MSRTMSILLGMGLAGLALVGCSKNNIAGPQDQASSAAYVRLPAPVDDSQGAGGDADRLEDASGSGDLEVLNGPKAVPADEGRDNQEILTRPVPADEGGSDVAKQGRPVVADGERY